MTGNYVFVNGEMVHSDRACISVFDRGLLYGDGFFETIRVDYGSPLFLNSHLERLYRACRLFNIEMPGEHSESWEERLSALIVKNGLSEAVAAAKILVTRGASESGLGLPDQTKPTVIMYARKYCPPDRDKYQNGIHAEVFPYPRHAFTADYKSLNYLFYLAARQWASSRKADEALILNSDGTVSEGAATNIFYVKNGAVFRPESPHYLRGIMEGQVSRLLKEQGRQVEAVPTTATMLTEAEEVFLTNSLLLVMPVAEIGDHALPPGKELGRALQEIDWLGACGA